MAITWSPTTPARRPQVKQAINVVYNYTEAYTTFGLKCALAPDVPNNEGSFRAVTVTAPEGSVLNCRHPAPTAARHLLGHFLPGMVLAALAPVVPDRAMAEGMAGLWSTNVHGQRSGRPPLHAALLPERRHRRPARPGRPVAAPPSRPASPEFRPKSSRIAARW